MLGYLVGGLAVVGIALGGFYMVQQEAESAGYEAGQKACVTQAAKDNAAAVERLKEQIDAQHDVNIRAHARAEAAHKALAAERAAHDQTRADQCNAGCRVHIPEGAQ